MSASIELMEQALHTSGNLLLQNNGSGMRYLFLAGETICVQPPPSVQAIVVGSIVLTKTDKLLMGGRVLEVRDSKLTIKSDCGLGAPMTIDREVLFGVVTHLYLAGHLRPLYSTILSRWIHRSIVRLSRRIVLKKHQQPVIFGFLRQPGMRLLLRLQRILQRFLRLYLRLLRAAVIEEEVEQMLKRYQYRII